VFFVSESVEALFDDEFVVEFADLGAVVAELLFADALSVEADWLLLLAVLASVLEAPLVPLLAEPVPVVARVLDWLPDVDDVAPPPEPLLVCAEFPPEDELPPVPLEAVALVAFEDAVSLLVLALVAEALSVDDDDVTSLAFAVLLDDVALVDAADLLALLVSDDVVANVELLLALAFSEAVLLEFAVSVELLVVVVVSVVVLLALAVWFRLAFKVVAELLVSEELDDSVSFS
jgi:hypothetical protein